MADTIDVTIVLRKTIPDEAAARALVSTVKARMADKPDVTVTAKINTTVDMTVV